MKNFKAGKKIKTIDELFKLDKVYVKNWQRCLPTSFLIHWPCVQVKQWIDNGNIFKAVKK